jgi:hypothetical protein
LLLREPRVFVNREKVHAFREMGHAANLSSERAFVWGALLRETRSNLARTVRGEEAGLWSLAAILIGIRFAHLGHLRGRLDRLKFAQDDDPATYAESTAVLGVSNEHASAVREQRCAGRWGR